MSNTTFIDYLVFEPRYVQWDTIKEKQEELEKEYPSVSMTEVYSGYWNECGFVFSVEKVSKELALEYFEEKRKDAYGE